MRVAIALMMAMAMTACSSDDEVDANYIVGEWKAAYHSKNPRYGDLATMLPFTFNADGTGSCRYGKTFRYKIQGHGITLTYSEQTVDEYLIVSISEDRMTWEEIPSYPLVDNSLYLTFYRTNEKEDFVLDDSHSAE